MVRKVVTLNMAFSEYNETMVRHRLAVLYKTPAHLIEISDLSYTTRRRRLVDGVTFTITIAPGSVDSNELVNLVSAIASINDTRLSASLGVDLTSTAAAQTTRLVVAESECPPGHWCSAGYTTACRAGFFNPNANVDSAAGCKRCPLYASGPVAAVDVSQCTCTNGFVPSLTNGVDKSGGFTCICPAGTEKRGDAQGNVFCGDCMSGMYKEDPNGQDTVCVACQQDGAVSPVGATSASECGCPAGKWMRPDDATCQSCPQGAQCPEATTPASIIVLIGRWRTSNTSVRIEYCLSPSHCLGGVNTSSFCPTGHTGPLCAVCEDAFRMTSVGCSACEGADASTVTFADVLPIIIVLSVLLPLVIGCCRVACMRFCRQGSSPSKRPRAYREPPKEMSQRIISSTLTKVKIFTAHQQVLQGLAGVFQITWPPAFTEAMAYLKVFNFDFISILPIDCIFPYNFLSALVVRTVAPLVLVAILILLGQSARRHGREALGYLLTNGGIVLVFMVYPSVTQQCFRFFQIHTFDGPYGRFLSADYSIDADGAAYKAMTPFAIAMVVVWPFGVPVIIAILLWRSRAPLLEVRRREQIVGGVYDEARWLAHVASRKRAGEQVDAVDEEAIDVEGFLWSLTESYRASAFFFEFIEYVLQKLTLVGLLVFFQPGSLEQLTLGLIVCFAYFGLCCFLLPFSSKTDNFMTCATQFSLFIAMLTAVIIEHGAEVPQTVVTILIVFAFVPAILAIMLSIHAAFNEMGINPCGALWRPIGRAVQGVVFGSTRKEMKYSEYQREASSPAPSSVAVTSASSNVPVGDERVMTDLNI